MSRRFAVALAGVLLFVDLVVLWSAAGQSSMTYLLPRPGGGTTTHRATYGPAVAAAVLAGLAALSAGGALTMALTRRLRAWMLWTAAAATLASMLVLVVVGGLDRPTF